MSVINSGRNIVLIGMMGSGKTTVGRLVADALRRPFVDTDDVVEAGVGKTISQVFSDHGERWFRAAEAEAVRGAAALRGQVIAVGGGAVLDPANVTRLKSNGDLVWLDASVPVLVANLATAGQVEGRPLLVGQDGQELEARLTHMREARLITYQKAATTTLTSHGRPPELLAEEIVRWAAAQSGLLAREERT